MKTFLTVYEHVPHGINREIHRLAVGSLISDRLNYFNIERTRSSIFVN